MKWSWSLAVLLVVGVLAYIRFRSDPAADARAGDAPRAAHERKDGSTDAGGSDAETLSPRQATAAGGETDAGDVSGPSAAGEPALAPAYVASAELAGVWDAILDGREPDAAALERASKDQDPEIARAVTLASSADPRVRRQGLQLAVERGAGGPGLQDALCAALVASNAKTRFGAKGDLPAKPYTVVSGDSLERIAKKHKQEAGFAVAPGLLRLVNGLKSNTIHPNQVLRLPAEAPVLRISKGSRRLRLYVGDTLVREYGVCIGKDDRTPAGTFRVETRQEKTPWRNPETGKLLYFGDPDYAIGTRWLGFEDTPDAQGIGIHGTNEPESIGKAESLGCLRMRNEEVEDLFDLVAIDTRVEVVEPRWFAW